MIFADSICSTLANCALDEGFDAVVSSSVYRLPVVLAAAMLLVTGNAESQTAELIDSGQVMRKPFTIAQLEERMARLLEDGRALATAS